MFDLVNVRYYKAPAELQHAAGLSICFSSFPASLDSKSTRGGGYTWLTVLHSWSFKNVFDIANLTKEETPIIKFADMPKKETIWHELIM